MRLLLLAIAIVVSAATAHADNGVGVVVTGDPTIQPQLAAQLEDWLRQRGHLLVPSPLPADSINTLIDCVVIEDLECARRAVEQHGKAPMLVFAKVEIADSTSGMRDVTITAYWFEAGTDAVAVRRTCERCTDETMRATTDELMSSLAGKGRAEVGQVSLTSSPPGASVSIDGKVVGITPLAYSLPPGDHAIKMTLDAYSDSARTVTIKRGDTAEVVVRMTSSRPRSKLPYAVIGGGGALLLTGILLYATSEEDTGEKPTYRDTKALGIGTSIVGLAAVGAGVYLLVRPHAAAPTSGPSVVVLPRGASVTWAGSF